MVRSNVPFRTLIIGAGVTGTALARELALRGHRGIVVVDKEADVATHTSGRNSGVVHAGYNQRPGTRKAALCVTGNRMMRELCRERGVPLVEGGILVVARTSDELPKLEELLRRGNENGVPGLRLVEGRDLGAIEPNVTGLAALHAPSGASVDARALVRTLAAEARELGVEFRLGAGVAAIEPAAGGFRARIGSEFVDSARLVNCGGLHADRIAHQLGAGLGYSILPVRGEYRLVRPEARHLVRSMVYPVPDLNFPFLGVHWTRTAHGEVKIGPNAVPALGREAYSWRDSTVIGAWELATSARAWRCLAQPGYLDLITRETWGSLRDRHFLDEARKLVPALRLTDLGPGPAGIRAQVVDAAGKLVDDLLVESQDRALHVLNVVSPGLTCSLAFAKHLADQFPALD